MPVPYKLLHAFSGEYESAIAYVSNVDGGKTTDEAAFRENDDRAEAKRSSKPTGFVPQPKRIKTEGPIKHENDPISGNLIYEKFVSL